MYKKDWDSRSMTFERGGQKIKLCGLLIDMVAQICFLNECLLTPEHCVHDSQFKSIAGLKTATVLCT